MANIVEPTEELQSMFEEWIAGEDMTDEIKAIARKYPPWNLYRLKTTDQKVRTISFSDNGTVRVLVSNKYNFDPTNTEVYGIDPNDLEECDIPEKTYDWVVNEQTGMISLRSNDPNFKINKYVQVFPDPKKGENG